MESEPAKEKTGLNTNEAPDNGRINKSSLPDEEERSSDASSSSSSSLRSSEFEDPGLLDLDEIGSLAAKDEQNDLASQDHLVAPYSFTDTSVDETLTKESPLQSPEVQKMERPKEGSGYRIPSYVFAREKSGTPMDWSTASNESLFSLHMETMSFTKDQFNYMLKPEESNGGEVAKLEDPRKSGPVENLKKPAVPISPAGDRPIAATTPANQSLDEKGKVGDDGSHGALFGTEKKEGLEIKMADPGKGKPPMTEEASPLSGRHSDGSGHSFAFPVLATDIDRGSSVKPGPDQPEQQQKPSSTEADESQTEAPKPAQSSWFMSCFPCCSRRS